jgi:hypothetical protein
VQHGMQGTAVLHGSGISIHGMPHGAHAMIVRHRGAASDTTRCGMLAAMVRPATLSWLAWYGREL